MMPVAKAQEIKGFLKNNNILSISLMGGEFFCNPDWKDIFEALIPGTLYTRLVTNGDWADNPEIPKFLSKFPNLKISISKDRWHSNKKVDKAADLCKKYSIKHNIATEEETSEESIVPVGRSLDSFNFFGSFDCWCRDPSHAYSFLIDEEGIVYKCGFGIWNYANVKDHLNGGFDAAFKKFNQKFNSCFVSNCRRCSQTYTMKERNML
jgi:hypothetical protein